MKPIEKIEFKNHELFAKQIFIPHKGLNIITSSNGRGKTRLLKYISQNYNKKHNIKSLLASIQHFKNFTTIDDYAKKTTRPPESRQFSEEYEIILKLQSDSEMIDECNSFFTNLKLNIQLNKTVALGGLLYFLSRNNKKFIPLDEISSGEKTAFIFWLITKVKNKPDVLLLDEFDSHMDEEVMNEYNNILQELSKEVQIFIATHRGHKLYGATYRPNSKEGENAWHIYDDGIIR